MARIDIRQLGKHFGNHSVIHQIDLTIENGEFMVLVGPSGCGKSTLLRMLAGLEAPTFGDILFDGQRVNDVAPAHRGAAMVFQSYALYPHMTVAENMAFGLRMMGVSRAERENLVRETADTLQLTALLDRYPRELSGGQRQRVAIGRAIVRRPKVFLFDEPLSNLDAALRVQMRIELARLHAELGTTMVYVTHDQTEAMTLGQRIAVFQQGRIEQVGPPMDLYQAPLNRFVAEFLGTPRINVLPHLMLDSGQLRIGSQTLSIDDWPVPLLERLRLGQALGIRPEAFVLCSPTDGLGGRVGFIENLGDTRMAYVRLDGVSDWVRIKCPSHGVELAADMSLGFQPDPAQVLVFDDDGKVLT